MTNERTWPNHCVLADADHFPTAAYLQGKRAGRDGLSTFTNPYPAGSAEHEEWRHGYFATQAAA